MLAESLFCLVLYVIYFVFIFLQKDSVLWVVAALTCITGALASYGFYHSKDIWDAADPVWYIAAAFGFMLALVTGFVLSGFAAFALRQERSNQNKGYE